MEQFGISEPRNPHENPPPDPVMLIQHDLLERHPDWIETHAEDFRALITAYPGIIEHYKTDPKEAVDEIEKFFYYH